MDEKLECEVDVEGTVDMRKKRYTVVVDILILFCLSLFSLLACEIHVTSVKIRSKYFLLYSDKPWHALFKTTFVSRWMTISTVLTGRRSLRRFGCTVTARAGLPAHHHAERPISVLYGLIIETNWEDKLCYDMMCESKEKR